MDRRAAGMFNRLALVFAVLFLATTFVARLLPTDLRVGVLVVGLGIVIGSYVIGGGLSIRTPPSTPIDMSTTFARVEADIRFRDRNTNWNLILGGAVFGGAIAIAGLASLLV